MAFFCICSSGLRISWMLYPFVDSCLFRAALALRVPRRSCTEANVIMTARAFLPPYLPCLLAASAQTDLGRWSSTDWTLCSSSASVSSSSSDRPVSRKVGSVCSCEVGCPSQSAAGTAEFKSAILDLRVSNSLLHCERRRPCIWPFPAWFCCRSNVCFSSCSVSSAIFCWWLFSVVSSTTASSATCRYASWTVVLTSEVRAAEGSTSWLLRYWSCSAERVKLALLTDCPCVVRAAATSSLVAVRRSCRDEMGFLPKIENRDACWPAEDTLLRLSVVLIGSIVLAKRLVREATNQAPCISFLVVLVSLLMTFWQVLAPVAFQGSGHAAWTKPSLMGLCQPPNRRCINQSIKLEANTFLIWVPHETMAPWHLSKNLDKDCQMSSTAGHSDTWCLLSATCIHGHKGQMHATPS